MKIVYVVHYYLPQHQAGTEVYTAALARKMKELGHQVSVFTSEDGVPKSGRFELREDRWEDIPVFRLVRTEPPDFERSYLDPEIDKIFAKFLEKKNPDVVHFQHTFRLSVGMLSESARAGCRTLLTLADFWHVCPPILMLQPGFALCPGPAPDRCARCGNAVGALYSGAPGSSLSSASNKYARMAGRSISSGADRAVRGVHWAKRRVPSALVEVARSWKRSAEERDPVSAYSKKLEMLEKRAELMKKNISEVDLVLAPSRFMKKIMVEAGAVDAQKIVHSDYGFEHGPFEGIGRKASTNIRFGFIGTPVEHKGLHVLVAAMNSIADTDAELRVYGDLSWFPAYAKKLRRLALNPRTRFMGRFEHGDIARVLSEIDVLVVPSLWYENSPLTIHEAFMAGAPVLVSDIGGMAELVEDGGGLTFAVGDDEDLSRKMRRLVEEKGLMGSLRKSIPKVKTVEEDAAELLKYYSP